MSYAEVLERLRRAGLDSLPGGGAEIFHPDVRERIAHDKATAEEYLEVHRVAHRMGMLTNATMLYGHIETFEHRVDHLLRLRALQDETKGLQAFIPLAFHPDGNGMRNLPAPTAIDALRPATRQRAARESLLGEHDTGGRANRPSIRRGRRRRDDRSRDDLSCGGLTLSEWVDGRAARPAHPGGGSHSDRA